MIIPTVGNKLSIFGGKDMLLHPLKETSESLFYNIKKGVKIDALLTSFNQYSLGVDCPAYIVNGSYITRTESSDIFIS